MKVNDNRYSVNIILQPIHYITLPKRQAVNGLFQLNELKDRGV